MGSGLPLCFNAVLSFETRATSPAPATRPATRRRYPIPLMHARLGGFRWMPNALHRFQAHPRTGSAASSRAARVRDLSRVVCVYSNAILALEHGNTHSRLRAGRRGQIQRKHLLRVGQLHGTYSETTSAAKSISRHMDTAHDSDQQECTTEFASLVRLSPCADWFILSAHPCGLFTPHLLPISQILAGLQPKTLTRVPGLFPVA